MGEPGAQGPQGAAGPKGDQGQPGMAGTGALKWVDATGTLVPGLYGGPYDQILTYIDTNGTGWSANNNGDNTWTVSTIRQGGAGYEIMQTSAVWATSDCTGTKYFGGQMSYVAARLAFGVTGSTTEYRAKKDAATVTRLTSYSAMNNTTCTAYTVPQLLVVSEADTTVVTPPTMTAVLPVHAEL